MASLVADYGTSSGEESDNSEANNSESCISTEIKPNSSTKSEINFFSVDAEGSDSDHNDTDGDDAASHTDSQTSRNTAESTKQNRLPNPLAERLPTPLVALQRSTEVENSVFSSSYQKAEAAKNFALEQHVKMTSVEIQAKSKDGKKICWNFRKGRCRFGQKCKYSHGQDIPSGAVTEESAAHPEADSSSFEDPAQYATGPAYADGSQYQADEHDEDSYMAEAKRKKRAGTSDALLPPKRAMKGLLQQREQERPWTVPH